jgi:hypothetical protein
VYYVMALVVEMSAMGVRALRDGTADTVVLGISAMGVLYVLTLRLQLYWGSVPWVCTTR